MDYQGLFLDLVDMWSRALNASAIPTLALARRIAILNLALECARFERDIFRRGLI